MNYEHRILNIENVIPYVNNARTHSDDQVAQLSGSIREFGFTNPILVDGENNLIAGHGRLLAARKLGITDIPAIIIPEIEEEKRKALIIADNKLALNAGWDQELLALELRAIGEYAALTGFSENELLEYFGGGIDEGLTDPDAVPEIPDKPVTKKGDVWLLEGHRVMCGDTTSSDDIDALMCNDQADMVWTDPPYNVNYEGGSGPRTTIENDDMESQAFRLFLLDSFATMLTKTKDGGCIYIAHADSEGRNFRSAMEDSGWMMKQCLIWAKNRAVLSRQDYNWQHEPILYGWKPGAAHYFAGDFTLTTLIDEAEEPSDMSKKELVELVEEIKKHQNSSVIRVDRENKCGLHPTMKPVNLVRQCVIASAREGEIVLDGFGGSGTTLITCQTVRRKARIMELDPLFCDVIVKRWQDFTGKEATLESAGEPFSG